MAADAVIPPGVVRALSIALYLAAGAFAVVTAVTWMVLLLNLVGIINWPRPIGIGPALTVVGFSIVINCALLWFLNRVRIVSLDPQTAKAIGRTIIIATLASAATAIGSAFQK